MATKTKNAAKPRATKSAARGDSQPVSSSGLVDDQLERYRSMRDFSKTAEPSGQTSSAAKTEGSALCHSEARRYPPALRLSPWIARGPQELGGDQRAEFCAR